MTAQTVMDTVKASVQESWPGEKVYTNYLSTVVLRKLWNNKISGSQLYWRNGGTGIHS